jgi:tol-pal system protein YbgF
MKHGFTGVLIGVACMTLVAAGLFGSSPVEAQTNRDPALFELFNRIEQLEQEIRQLRGDLEVYRYRQEDLERRLQTMNGVDSTADFSTPSNPPPEPEPSITYSTPSEVATLPVESTPGSWDQPAVPATVPDRPAYSPTGDPSIDERAAYNTAFNRLREGRYNQAISGFESFLRTYPNSGFAGNAQYWLGEAFYVSRDFDRAKEAFIELGINYPASDRMPDTLLKLGYIYDETGEPAKAREVLQKLLDTYPSSQAARLAASRLSTLR